MATSADKIRIKDICEELLGCLDYEETCDSAKAARVITLTKQLLLMRHDSAAHAGSSFSNSPEKLQKLQDDARVWLKANGGSGGTGSGGTGSIAYHQPHPCFRG